MFPSRSLLPLRPRRKRPFLLTFLLISLSIFLLFLLLTLSPPSKPLFQSFRQIYQTLINYDWRDKILFHITPPMRLSIYLSFLLGSLLGLLVGLLSGLELSILVGVSASMALGCVFVMSFAILNGVNALRAVFFALLVSICLPLGFGIGFGCGVLIGVFWGGEDVQERGEDLVKHGGEVFGVVRAFTLEIL